MRLLSNLGLSIFSPFKQIERSISVSTDSMPDVVPVNAQVSPPFEYSDKLKDSPEFTRLSSDQKAILEKDCVRKLVAEKHVSVKNFSRWLDLKNKNCTKEFKCEIISNPDICEFIAGRHISFDEFMYLDQTSYDALRIPIVRKLLIEKVFDIKDLFELPIAHHFFLHRFLINAIEQQCVQNLLVKKCISMRELVVWFYEEGSGADYLQKQNIKLQLITDPGFCKFISDGCIGFKQLKGLDVRACHALTNPHVRNFLMIRIICLDDLKCLPAEIWLNDEVVFKAIKSLLVKHKITMKQVASIGLGFENTDLQDSVIRALKDPIVINAVINGKLKMEDVLSANIPLKWLCRGKYNLHPSIKDEINNDTRFFYISPALVDYLVKGYVTKDEISANELPELEEDAKKFTEQSHYRPWVNARPKLAN